MSHHRRHTGRLMLDVGQALPTDRLSDVHEGPALLRFWNCGRLCTAHQKNRMNVVAAHKSAAI
jgi:hypothetical protein